MLPLPSQVDLAERIASWLTEGGVAELRGLPLSGRSHVVDLAALEARSLVEVFSLEPDGASQSVLNNIEQLLEQGTNVACFLDDFDDLLRTPVGQQFQARLHAMATDATKSGTIGILLVSRVNESLVGAASTGPGSPLASLTTKQFGVSALDASEIVAHLVTSGSEKELADSLVDEYGGLVGLIDDAVSGAPPTDKALDSVIYRTVADVGGASAERLFDLDARPDGSLPTTATDVALGPLVVLDRERTRLVPALRSRGAIDLVVGGESAWPGALSKSARRFRCRLEGMVDPIWADRYLGLSVTGLQAFLETLSNRECSCTLRLLSGPEAADKIRGRQKRDFIGRAMTWSARGLHIEWRTTSTHADYQLIHQRQLVSPNRTSGYILPPCDRIVLGTNGSDVDSYLARTRFPLIQRAWDRGTPLT